MSVEFYRESPGKFDSGTLNRKTLNRGAAGCNKDNLSHKKYLIFILVYYNTHVT